METETIVAPATPPGEGGVAIVRVSGPLAEELLGRFVHLPGSAPESHKLYRGYFRDSSGKTVDEVLWVIMRAPHSFTREDVVEVHCHGGPVPVRNIVDRFLEAGARLARPGEFTLRAYLNGRLDLSQAEAVIDLIRARSDAAGRVALAQLQGKLGTVLGGYRDRLLFLLAEVETHIDFSEEDISLPEMGEICKAVSALQNDVSSLVATFDSGRRLQTGARVLILGKPNVGKSSLLNLLLGEARAIVTDVPGTTRDTLEESLVLNGVPLQLIDTAGLRPSEDPVEQMGMQRARDKIAGSDLILLVVDGSTGIDGEDRACLELCPEDRTILVVNKCDLGISPTAFDGPGLLQVAISAKRGDGFQELCQKIGDLLGGGMGPGDVVESVVIYERRHREALLRAHRALDASLAAAEEQLPPELMALELRSALDAIGEVTGETTPGDVLDAIFSRFCIGK